MLSKLLKKTEVKKNLTISVIGTGLGQIIHLAATPILSRIYTPESFGQYSLFLSFLGIFTAISLMKLDLAIIASKTNEVKVLNKATLKICAFTILLVLLIYLILSVINNQHQKIFLFLTLAVFISNRFWTHRAIVNKAAHFKKLSLGKILENGTSAFTAISFGLINLKDYGLIIGKILGLFFSWLFYKKVTKQFFQESKDTSTKEIIQKYINYPKYSFPAELITHLNLNISIFLFVYYFSSLEVGLIGITTRVLSIPANFISISFFDVFKQKAAKDYTETGEFRTIFVKFFLTLFPIALLMVAIITLTGPSLFTMVLGVEWEKAGIYAQYLCVFYAIRLVAGPLVFSFELTNKHFVNLIFQSLYLATGILSIMITHYFGGNDVMCITVYSVSLSFLYSIHILLAYKNSSRKD